MKKEGFEVKVLRYDSERDRVPCYRTYPFAKGKRMRVLDLLKDIYRNLDGDLAFRWSCGTGKCGTCAVMVNGRPVLSCQEIVENQNLVIEPLHNYPVIKDLIISRDAYDEALRSVMPFLKGTQLAELKTPSAPGWEAYKERVQCVECLSCMSMCPAMTLNPAGFRGPTVMTALGKWHTYPQESADSFYLCTGCDICTTFCPSKVKVAEGVQQGRRQLFASGATPEALMKVKENIAKTGNVYAASKEDRTAAFPKGIRKELKAGVIKRKAKTVVFLGCVSSFLDMKIVPGLFKILEAGNVDYTLLSKEEICCGLPLKLMGDEEGFKTATEAVTLRIKETGAEELITPCAGCYKAFLRYYPEMEGIKIFHSVQFIQELVKGGRIRLSDRAYGKVTYHDPCDMGRSFEIFEEPRKILLSIPGLDLVEMSQNRLAARCCGGGGGLMASNPEAASDMAALRVKDAVQVGAGIIVSGCPACKDNLKKGIKRISKQERPDLKVMDITEIVADSLV